MLMVWVSLMEAHLDIRCCIRWYKETQTYVPVPINNPTTEFNIPSFVGSDYFCETGVPTGTTFTNGYFYPNGDRLWDGEGCGPSSTCCTFNNPPWFCKQLPQTTTDDMEVSVLIILLAMRTFQLNWWKFMSCELTFQCAHFVQWLSYAVGECCSYLETVYLEHTCCFIFVVTLCISLSIDMYTLLCMVVLPLTMKKGCNSESQVVRVQSRMRIYTIDNWTPSIIGHHG